MWSSMASRMSANASSRVSAAATHPGRSGAYRAKRRLPFLNNNEIAHSVSYFFEARLLQDTIECAAGTSVPALPAIVTYQVWSDGETGDDSP